MGIFCLQCEEPIHGNIDDFRKHISTRNHVPPYSCSEGDCVIRKFMHRNSLIRHLRDHHSDLDHLDDIEDDEDANVAGSSSPEPDVVAAVPLHMSDDDEEMVEALEHEEAGAAHEPAPAVQEPGRFENRIERLAALMILRLRKRGNVPGTVISAVIEEAGKLIVELIDETKSQLCSNLRNVSNVSELTLSQSSEGVHVSNPFQRLKTKEQQMGYFKEHFGLVEPIPKFIRYRFDQRLDPNTNEMMETQVPCTFQYIPQVETLTAVLRNPVLYKLIHEEKASTDGCMRSYLDGALAQNHPLISQHPHTLRLVLFADDFECVNSLGSKKNIHKVVGVYYLIQNLPPEENARLRSIHVAAYGYREDCKNERGIDTLLEPFFEDLKQLESDDGVTVEVNNEPYQLRATLIACAADGLSAPELLGLSPPSCDRFCRDCMITRSELHQDIMAMGEERTEELHRMHVEQVRLVGEAAKKAYGVERDALLLTEPKYANKIDVVVSDGMHDFLRGIVNMEIRLTLSEYCSIKKYFSVDLLNARIQSFNYGMMDSKNKPSANFSLDSLTDISGYNLSQTAAQSWCLLRAFPFLFGDLVPQGDRHLRMIVLLKRITDIVFSSVVPTTDIDLLTEMLREHHQLFFTLYPPVPTAPEDSCDQIELEEQETEGNENEAIDAENQDEREQAEVDEIEGEAEDNQNEEIDAEDHGDGEDDTLPEASVSLPQGKRKKKKKKKKVRPINKHHHALHYAVKMEKFGPVVLYWCMRFEGKHAIAKRYAAICCNFKNLPLTLADMHQINHAAEMLEINCAVKDELKITLGPMVVAGQTQHFEVLSTVGLQEDSVIYEVKAVTLGGFEYRKYLFITTPLCVNALPVFASVVDIYSIDNTVYLVVEEWKTEEYNINFGAYFVKKTDENETRVFDISDLNERPIL